MEAEPKDNKQRLNASRLCLCILVAGLIGLSLPRVLTPLMDYVVFVERRPNVDVYYVDQETGVGTYAGIPEEISFPDSNFVTPSFIKVVAERTKRPEHLPQNQQVQVALLFDEIYLDSFFKKTRLGAWFHLRFLRTVPVWKVEFVKLPTEESQLDQWKAICETLGSIPTFKRLRIMPINENHTARAVVAALERMPHLTHVHLAVNDDPEPDPIVTKELAQAMQGLSSLTHLTLDLSRSNTRAMLPAMENLSSLQDLSIVRYHNERSLSVDESLAVSHFVASIAVPTVTLNELLFATDAASQQFCQDIAQTKAKSLTLSYLHLANAGCLVEAIAASSGITDLKVVHWSTRDSLAVFLSKLAKQLPTMKLRTLDLQDICFMMYTGEDVDDEECRLIMETLMPTVIQAAAKNPSLREFRLPYPQVTPDMDTALADLALSSDSHLQVLAVGCPVQPTTGTVMPIRYPLFLEALQSNNHIQEIILQYRIPEGESNFTYQNPWDSEFMKEVAKLTMQNKAKAGIEDH